MISLMGSWVQLTAQGFLIYELTNSMAYLGYVGLASGLPTALFMLYAGVLADRVPRRNLLLLTQTLMMILAFILYFLVQFDLVMPWHILVLSSLLGIATSFETPARHAFVNELVPKNDLTNAIALNSIMFNLAAVVGPSIAGILYATIGAHSCFLINGLSYLGIIFVLLNLKSFFVIENLKKNSTYQDLKEGLVYCYNDIEIRSLIVLLFFITCMGMSYATLLPAWAKSILGGNSETFGYLQAAKGIGSLLGALFVASQKKVGNFHQKLFVGLFSFPLFLWIFAIGNHITYSLIGMAGIGLGLMMVFNSVNGLLQMMTDDRMRGRIMSIYSISFFGGLPIGSFLSGYFAEIFGAKAVLEFSGIGSLVIAFLFLKTHLKRSLNQVPKTQESHAMVN